MSDNNRIVITNQEFLEATFSPLYWQTAHVCAFPNDPDKAGIYDWGGMYAHEAKTKGILERADWNQYFTVSLFWPNPTGKSRRRKDDFMMQCCITIDDIGTGPGAKVPWSVLEGKPQVSYLLETSPDNYHAGYIIKFPPSDKDLMVRVINALIAQGLMSNKDPGMRGVTRYVRMPVGINNKEKYLGTHPGGFPCQLAQWRPEIKYTIEEIVSGWGLVLEAPGSSGELGLLNPDGTPRVRESDDPDGYDFIEAVLEEIGLRGRAQGNGYYGCPCPNEEAHTTKDGRTGYYPDRGFNCFHGSCEHLTVGDLNNWLKETYPVEYGRVLEARNTNPQYIENMFGPPLNVPEPGAGYVAENGQVVQGNRPNTLPWFIDRALVLDSSQDSIEGIRSLLRDILIHLDVIEIDQVLDELSESTGKGKTILRSMLSDYKKQMRQEGQVLGAGEATAARDGVNGPIPTIEIDRGGQTNVVVDVAQGGNGPGSVAGPGVDSGNVGNQGGVVSDAAVPGVANGGTAGVDTVAGGVAGAGGAGAGVIVGGAGTGELPQLPVTSYMQVYPDITITADRVVPKQTTANLKGLAQAARVDLYFNMVTKKIEVVDHGQYGFGARDSDNVHTRMEDFAIRCGMSDRRMKPMLRDLAMEKKYHPLINYLYGVQWDGADRIQQVMDCIETGNGHKEHFALILRKWLVSIIAAVYGYGVVPPRGVLTFVGNQYIGKTSFLRKLAPQVIGGFKEGVHLNLAGAGETDSVRKSTSALVVELGELDATFRKSDISALKAFIGRDSDEYRLPYGTDLIEWPRQTVFAASVNEPDFLKDATGNTRYWTVKAEKIDLDAMSQVNNQQLWAQIKHLYDSGETWTMSKEQMVGVEAINAQHREISTVEEELLTHFDWDDEVYAAGKPWDKDTGKGEESVIRMTSREIARKLGMEDQFGVATSRFNRDLTKALKILTCMNSPHSSKINRKKVRVWYLPRIIDFAGNVIPFKKSGENPKIEN